jgi:hypothetical protein
MWLVGELVGGLVAADTEWVDGGSVCGHATTATVIALARLGFVIALSVGS